MQKTQYDTLEAMNQKVFNQQHLSLAEVISALSYALDLTEGQPPGHSLRCCWIGMHLGKVLALPNDQMWDLYYSLLLKDAGCSSNPQDSMSCMAVMTGSRKKTLSWSITIVRNK